MAYPAAPEGAGGAAAGGGVLSRKEKRKALKKQKRKQVRKESAIKEREEEEELENDPEEQLRVMLREKEDAEAVEMARREFEERERLWLEAAATRRKAQEEAEEEEARRTKLLEEAHHDKEDENNESGNDGEWEYIEEGPAEIIWLDNEIIVKKKRVKVHKRSAGQEPGKEDDNRPTSNPLPPQSEAFTAYQSAPPLSAQDLLGSVAQQTPHFGTEQDKAHCPFHLKTGACRFGSRCSRVHFYPDKSCTLLVKNMYSGPGIAWDQDEGLEVRKILPTDVKIPYHVVLYETAAAKITIKRMQTYVTDDDKLSKKTQYGILQTPPNTNLDICWFPGTRMPGVYWDFQPCLGYTDEEIEHSYEEFYEDVHTEFLKFGEIINFKVCRNGSFHLRGNVYVHYKYLESAVLACNSMNGRYFAGKQITCEFVGVTRWKVAICGEYMKSRLKTCSRGTACNFIHCFRNPGGDYEWADWDNPPPKHWVKKMAALFGPSVEAECHGHSDFEESEPPERSSRKTTTPADNRFYSRSRHRERDFQDHGSDKDYSDGHEGWHSKQSTRKEHLNRRQMRSFHDGWDQPDRREYSKDGHSSSKHISRSRSSWENVSREKERDRIYKYRKYKENVSVCNERSSRDNNRSNSSGRGRMKTLSDDQRKPEMSQYPERYNGQSGSPDQDADEGHYNESRDKSSPSDEGSRSPAGICRNTSMEPHCEREFSHECRSDHDNNLDESKEFCEHHTKYHSRYTPVRDQDGSGRKESHFRSMHTGSNQSLSCIESEETCSSTTENSEDSHYCHRKKYNSRHKGSRHRKAYPAEDCGKDSDCADTDLRRSTSRKRSRSRTSHHSSSSRKRKEPERFT